MGVYMCGEVMGEVGRGGDVTECAGRVGGVMVGGEVREDNARDGEE